MEIGYYRGGGRESQRGGGARGEKSGGGGTPAGVGPPRPP